MGSHSNCQCEQVVQTAIRTAFLLAAVCSVYTLRVSLHPAPRRSFSAQRVHSNVPQLRVGKAVCPSHARRLPKPIMGTVKETAVRSFVKVSACPLCFDHCSSNALAERMTQAAGWRFTAGCVTAASSFIFTGSLATAASIVGWDLISKSGTMFIGERLWNNVKWGKSDKGDSSQRSLAKALAWRLFAAINTLFAAVVLTKGKAGVAGKIAGSDSVVKTVLFFFYERVWSVVAWGKFAAPDEEKEEPPAGVSLVEASA